MLRGWKRASDTRIDVEGKVVRDVIDSVPLWKEGIDGRLFAGAIAESWILLAGKDAAPGGGDRSTWAKVNGKAPDVLLYTLIVGDVAKHDEDDSPDLASSLVIFGLEWHAGDRPSIVWRRDEVEEERQKVSAAVAQAVLQIQIDPANFRGGFPMTCGDEHGEKGCGKKVLLGALRVERKGELHGWWSPCPECGKRWWMLTTNRSIRALQKQALSQMKKKGGFEARLVKDLREAIRVLRVEHLNIWYGEPKPEPPPPPVTAATDLASVPDDGVQH